MTVGGGGESDGLVVRMKCVCVWGGGGGRRKVDGEKRDDW